MQDTGAGTDVNALLDEARIPQLVKGAAAALAGAGVAVALTGVQNLTLVHWLGAWVFLPLTLVVVGAGGIAVAAKLLRARRWSLQAGLLAAALMIVVSLGFFVVGALSGVFTLLSLLGFGAGIAALVLAILAVKPFRRLMTTRQKLREAGFDLDL